MPRGFRVAVYNSEAEVARRPQFTMVMAAESWLPAACWCDTEIVGVKQREVWWGTTRSCGRPKCVHPETGERVLGMAVHGKASLLVDDFPCVEAPGVMFTKGAAPNLARAEAAPQHALIRDRAALYRRPSRENSAMPGRAIRRRRRRMTGDDVAVRRDLVAAASAVQVLGVAEVTS